MSTLSMFRLPVSIALALTASIAIVSCGDTKTPTATVTNVAITAPAGSATTLTVGATTKAIASVVGTNTPAQTVNWSSSVPAVATVDATGLIKAVAPGTTVVKATSTVDTSKSAQVTITVNAATSTTPTVTGVTVALNPVSAPVGGTSQATATVTGTNNPSQAVTWTSSVPTVASIDPMTGKITALTAGKTDIVAKSTFDATKSSAAATFTVTAAGVLTTAKINFQTAPAVTLPTGYSPNTGAAYNATTGIGWVTEASVGAAPVALDVTANARNRGVSNGVTDPRLYTQVNMQCDNQLTGNPCSGGELKSAAFQYKVVNGTYAVTVGVGEASDDVNSVMQINFESKTANEVNAVSKFVSGPAARNLIVTKTVTVADGMLTVDAIGGNNTKINFLEITPAPTK